MKNNSTPDTSCDDSFNTALFWDILPGSLDLEAHAPLAHFSLSDILAFFVTKYQNRSSFTVIKSLAYFDDANMEPDPMSLTNMSWEHIKANLRLKLHDTV